MSNVNKKVNPPDEEFVTPQCITQQAEAITASLLPEKSKPRYELKYKNYQQWKSDKKVQHTTEDVLLVYFKELSMKYKSSSL